MILIPPIFFFVQTHSLQTGVCLEKTKQNTELNYFHNFKSQSILLSSLVVGQREGVTGSHLCLLE